MWISCEDSGDSKEDFIINENIVECGMVEHVNTFYNDDGTVGTYNVKNSEWDGLTRTEYVNGELNYQITYNEYGNPIEELYYPSGRRVTREYADGWKQLSRTSVDSSGDTSSYRYSVWDNLTRTEYRTNGQTSIWTYSPNYYTFIRKDDYNIDGELIWTNLHERMDDGRRWKMRYWGNLYTDYGWNEFTWNGNEATVYTYQFPNPSNNTGSKYIEVYNEYLKVTKSEEYNFVEDEWILKTVNEFNWDCSMFTPYYP